MVFSVFLNVWISWLLTIFQFWEWNLKFSERKSKLFNKECIGPFSFKFYDYKDINYYDNDSPIKKALKESIAEIETNNIKIT